MSLLPTHPRFTLAWASLCTGHGESVTIVKQSSSIVIVMKATVEAETVKASAAVMFMAAYQVCLKSNDTYISSDDDDGSIPCVKRGN